MVEAAASVPKQDSTITPVKLVIGMAGQEKGTVNVAIEQAETLLGVLQSKSLSSIETAMNMGQPTVLPQSLTESENFWRQAFKALTESGTIQAIISSAEGHQDKVQSMLKMHGFTDVQFSNPAFDQGSLAVIARKPAFKQGGTSLKNRKKQAAPADANPWANLNDDDAAQINEDSLMADEQKVSAMTDKFAGECDRIMPGKPCANCTCGKKELMEGVITEAQLETGQVESSCGKCYLGDAFRCAGCPYRGKPAFEPGEKVKIIGKDTTSAANDASMMKASEVATAATGSTKVVLEL